LIAKSKNGIITSVKSTEDGHTVEYIVAGRTKTLNLKRGEVEGNISS
jgi:hypothetical protein